MELTQGKLVGKACDSRVNPEPYKEKKAAVPERKEAWQGLSFAPSLLSNGFTAAAPEKSRREEMQREKKLTEISASFRP